MFSINRLLSLASCLLSILAALTLGLLIFMIGAGFPAPAWLPHAFGTKSLRKTFQILLLLTAATLIIHPKRKEWVNGFFEALTRLSAGQGAIWILVGVYSLLFLWHQLSSYLAAQINFLPFSFYDYMLYYFPQGAVNFTGLLHGFYHINNILYILTPLWLLFKSSLVLVVIHGPLVALAALPLFFVTRRLFPNSWIPLAVSLLYLNFRYILNLIEMDFLVESFYPLFFFTIFYFLVAGKRAGFMISVFLTLLIKEDAAFYVLALGVFLLFFKDRRTYGLGAIALAVLCALVTVKLLVPLTKNSILVGTANNFLDVGNNPKDILVYYLTHPWAPLTKLFWPYAKIKTQLNFLSWTFFLPLLSPWYLMVLATLTPPFCMWNDANGYFTSLKFHYSATVIPFLFFAFLMGLKNLSGWLNRLPWRESVLRLMFFLLIVTAGGNYLSYRPADFQLKTIREVSKIPTDKILVTQGHLLPYAGYRIFNFYFQQPYERETHPYHALYTNADYYFLARSVDAYPFDSGWIENKITELKKDKKLRLVYDDGERVLFERIEKSVEIPKDLNPYTSFSKRKLL